MKPFNKRFDNLRRTVEAMNDALNYINYYERDCMFTSVWEKRAQIKRYWKVYNRLERIRQYNLDIIQGKREDSKLKVA